MASSILFVDARVAADSQLPWWLTADTEVVVIDAGRDGIDQIAAALQGQTDLSAIHVLAHGAEGKLFLGSTTLDAQSVEGYAGPLAAIGASLAANGDILLYGCDTGAGSSGAALVDALARLTGADVAASNDPTGAAALGGDWSLEVSSGAVESAPLAFEEFSGLLAAPVVTPGGTFDTGFSGDGIATADFN